VFNYNPQYGLDASLAKIHGRKPRNTTEPESPDELIPFDDEKLRRGKHQFFFLPSKPVVLQENLRVIIQYNLTAQRSGPTHGGFCASSSLEIPFGCERWNSTFLANGNHHKHYIIPTISGG
jgi:hypothetical protein